MKRNLRRVVLTLVGSAILLVPASASAAGCAASATAYSANNPLETGLIVRLDSQDPDKVKAVGKADADKMFGVVVDQNQVPITSVAPGTTNPAFVASDGSCQYNTLVSTENGDIGSGDYITISSVSGVGMEAGTTPGKVFGRAATAFNKNSVILEKIPLKDASGNTAKTVEVGLVPVTIDIRDNPNLKSTKANLPQWLERIGRQVGGQDNPDPVRLWISVGVSAIALIWSIIILYAGIRNAVISIGRNPMSRRSIFRALTQVILTSLLILVIGLFAVYLLLRL